MKVFLVLGFIAMASPTPTTITAPPVVTDNVVNNEKDDLKNIFGQCLHKKDVSKCLKHRVIAVIDDVTKNDEPLSVNLFNIKMSLNKDPQYKGIQVAAADTSRTFEDVISQKLKTLLESRVIQVKLADDTKENEEVLTDANEARKKKGGGGGKHGTMMMSGKKILHISHPIHSN